jgi:putative membrane protein
MGWHMGGIGWSEMLLVGFFMLLFWGVIIVLAFFAIRWIVRSGNRNDVQDTSFSRGANTPLEILRERYARGEITREEYLDMKRELEE